MTHTHEDGPLNGRAIWYRRGASDRIHCTTDGSAVLQEERARAGRIAAEAGASVVGEFTWVGSSRSPRHGDTWMTLLQLLKASNATYCVVLHANEIARTIVDYYGRVQQLHAAGVTVLHGAGEPDWTPEIDNLLRAMAAHSDTLEVRERPERKDAVRRQHTSDGQISVIDDSDV